MAQIGAMILAAGLGTRLKPWTDKHPKALALVNGQSLLERNIRYLQAAGIMEVVINVHHFAGQIVDTLQKNNGWGSVIHVSDETEMVLETGGGLIFAQPLLQKFDYFVLLNCDILSTLNIKDLVSFHIRNEGLASLAVSQRPSSRSLLFNDKLEMAGWQNNTTSEVKLPAIKRLKSRENLTPFSFSGIHCLSAQIFTTNRLEGKFSMIDLYLDLCPEHKIIGYNHSGDRVLDVGKPEALALAQEWFH